MDALMKLRETLANSGKQVVIATVKSADTARLTCNVVFDGEKIVRENIPLRIYNDDGALGFAVVPRVGSEVLVVFVRGKEGQPRIIGVQEWDQIIIRKPRFEIVINSEDEVLLKKKSGFVFTIDKEDKVSIGNMPAHTLIHGDRALPLFNSHIHLTPDGPSQPPLHQITPKEIFSEIFTVE
jgi:hypothetical protein